MDDEEFIKAARVLSSDHGLRILRAFSDDGWKIASEISSKLGIHTSTASKYLDQLFKGGFLERRVRRTGRRSTLEYHLKEPVVLLEVDLAGGKETRAIESWDVCLTVFHKLIDNGYGFGFTGFDEEVDRLIQRLKSSTDHSNLCLFDPKCDVSVAKRLVRKKMEDGQLDDRVSTVREISNEVFGALKTLCVERIGSPATQQLFASAMSEIERNDGRIVRKLGLTETLERGFGNE